MEIIKFTLRGKFAHFNNPETNLVNTTFPQIHKTIIKGIIGAIIGLTGYNGSYLKNKKDIEFLTKLETLKIGIVPKNEYGIIDTHMYEYVNQTGYASEEKKKGQTLLIKEICLVNPIWDIYIDLENVEKDIKEKIEDYLMNSKMEYPFYLGKNNYFGIIENVEKINKIIEKEPKYISSLVSDEYFELSEPLDNDDIAYGNKIFLTNFYLPMDIDNEIGYIKYKNFNFSNLYIEKIKNNDFICIKDKLKNIILF